VEGNIFKKEQHSTFYFSFVSTSIAFEEELLFVLKYRMPFVTNAVIINTCWLFLKAALNY